MLGDLLAGIWDASFPEANLRELLRLARFGKGGCWSWINGVPKVGEGCELEPAEGVPNAC